MFSFSIYIYLYSLPFCDFWHFRIKAKMWRQYLSHFCLIRPQIKIFVESWMKTNTGTYSKINTWTSSDSGKL